MDDSRPNKKVRIYPWKLTTGLQPHRPRAPPAVNHTPLHPSVFKILLLLQRPASTPLCVQEHRESVNETLGIDLKFYCPRLFASVLETIDPEKMKFLVIASLCASVTSFHIPAPKAPVSKTALFAANGEVSKKIIVLGGDGFCGWPTSLYLSDRGHDVVVVDNLSRRKIDLDLGCDSLTPIQSPEVSDAVAIFIFQRQA